MQSQERRTEVSSKMGESCPSASPAFIPVLWSLQIPDLQPPAAPHRTASHRA